MRPYLLQHHDEREDHPATITEFDLDLLEARARWGVTGAWIAVAAVVLLLGLLARSEWNAHRIEASSRATNAALTETVRALTDRLAEQASDSRLATTVVAATEDRYDRLRGQVASIAARQQALTVADDALATRLDQQGTHIANLGLWRSQMDDARSARDARIGALEATAQSRGDAVDARLATLDRKVDSIDRAVTVQGLQERSTRSRQNAMVAAVPIFLAPYLHVLDHSGR